MGDKGSMGVRIKVSVCVCVCRCSCARCETTGQDRTDRLYGLAILQYTLLHLHYPPPYLHLPTAPTAQHAQKDGETQHSTCLHRAAQHQSFMSCPHSMHPSHLPAPNTTLTHTQNVTSRHVKSPNPPNLASTTLPQRAHPTTTMNTTTTDTTTQYDITSTSTHHTPLAVPPPPHHHPPYLTTLHYTVLHYTALHRTIRPSSHQLAQEPRPQDKG